MIYIFPYLKIDLAISVAICGQAIMAIMAIMTIKAVPPYGYMAINVAKLGVYSTFLVLVHTLATTSSSLFSCLYCTDLWNKYNMIHLSARNLLTISGVLSCSYMSLHFFYMASDWSKFPICFILVPRTIQYLGGAEGGPQYCQ